MLVFLFNPYYCTKLNVFIILVQLGDTLNYSHFTLVYFNGKFADNIVTTRFEFKQHINQVKMAYSRLFLKNLSDPLVCISLCFQSKH